MKLWNLNFSFTRLKFTGGTSGLEVYVSCDMFYVEVLLDADGKVKDVKVELAGDKNDHEGQVDIYFFYIYIA